MKLRYAPEAIRDLQKIRTYIREDLCNPSAADRIIRSILDSCAVLREYPLMGVSVQEKTGFETQLRMLVCGRYLAFYQVYDSAASVARVLDGRQDYLALLFGD